MARAQDGARERIARTVSQAAREAQARRAGPDGLPARHPRGERAPPWAGRGGAAPQRAGRPHANRPSTGSVRRMARSAAPGCGRVRPKAAPRGGSSPTPDAARFDPAMCCGKARPAPPMQGTAVRQPAAGWFAPNPGCGEVGWGHAPRRGRPRPRMRGGPARPCTTGKFGPYSERGEVRPGEAPRGGSVRTLDPGGGRIPGEGEVGRRSGGGGRQDCHTEPIPEPYRFNIAETRGRARPAGAGPAGGVRRRGSAAPRRRRRR